MTVTLTAGGAGSATGDASVGSDTFTGGVRRVRGSEFDDIYDASAFSGSSGFGSRNIFEGLGGDDTITGNGNTEVQYDEADAGVTVTLTGGGAGTAFGTAGGDIANIGTDTFTGGVRRVVGSDFDDIITGDEANNIFDGEDGNDTIEGGTGNDTLRGGAGDDFLQGGAGADTLDGGTGLDTFAFQNSSDGFFIDTNRTRTGSELGDTLVGFQTGIDTLEFDATNFGLAAGALAEGTNFSIIGAAYDGTNAGANSEFDLDNPTFIYSTADKTLYYDADGDATDNGYTVVATVQSGDDIAVGDIAVV